MCRAPPLLRRSVCLCRVPPPASGPCPTYCPFLLLTSCCDHSHNNVTSGSLSPTSGSRGPTSGSHGASTGSGIPGNWNPDVKACPFAALVHFSRTGKNPQWEPFSYQQIKELCKGQKEFGRESQYFKSLMQATFTSNVLVPHDLKNIFPYLFSPSEYSVWDRR